MFETFVLFIAGYLLTWQALIILLLVGIFFEHVGSRKMAVFVGIVAIVSSYFFFDASPKAIGIAAVSYLVIGVVWSFWRYNVYVSHSVQRLRERHWKNTDHYDNAIGELAPSRNLNLISGWIIVWPFSAIENLLGDVITAVQTLVTKVFKGVYHKIYMSHIQPLPSDPKAE